MAIEAAIFDFDGTLVDSMDMWDDVLDRWLTSYDLELSPEVLNELEPLSVPEECKVIHERFGIGTSGEQLNESLNALLKNKYEHSVQPWAPVPALIKDLVTHNIPLVIATSTDAYLVRACLRVHGLETAFKTIVTTDDVGTDKTQPDVYLAAHEHLGTPYETTWVFEDAPFGLRSAQRAGFRCAAIYDPHSDRDLAELQTYSDLVSVRCEDLSFDMLNGIEP